MSNGMKVGIVAILLIALGAWYANSNSGSAPTEGSQPTTSSESAGQTMGSSDQSIDQDVASIDASLKALDSDSANADASLSDKPVTQGE